MANNIYILKKLQEIRMSGPNNATGNSASSKNAAYDYLIKLLLIGDSGKFKQLEKKKNSRSKNFSIFF